MGFLLGTDKKAIIGYWLAETNNWIYEKAAYGDPQWVDRFCTELRKTPEKVE